MAANASPQPLAVGETNSNPNPATTYATRLITNKTAQTPSKAILKLIEIVHEEPTVKFTMEELGQFTVEEGLHQALVLKFSFERLEMQELRKFLPKLFGIQGRSLIGWLARRHILIRFDLYEDYVAAASNAVNHLFVNGENHQLRIFPWTLGFNPKEETSRAFVWISLPNLPPMLFAKRSLLSIASAVGKPIAIDKATQEKSRPSTARVKVELDLLDKKSNRVRIHYVDEKTGQIMEFYQEVVYDNLPQFCSYCKHQGHGENSCRLLQEKNDVNEKENPMYDGQNIEKYQGDLRNLLDEKKKAVMVSSTANAGDRVTEKMNAGGTGFEIVPAAEVPARVDQELKVAKVSVGDRVSDGGPKVSDASQGQKIAVVSGVVTAVGVVGQVQIAGQKPAAIATRDVPASIALARIYNVVKPVLQAGQVRDVQDKAGQTSTAARYIRRISININRNILYFSFYEE